MADAHQPPARLPYEKLDLFELRGGQFGEPKLPLPAFARERHRVHRRFHGPQAGERLGFEPQGPRDFIRRKAGDGFRRKPERLRPDLAGQNPDPARPTLTQTQRGFHLGRQIVGGQALLFFNVRNVDRSPRAEFGAHQPVAGHKQDRVGAGGLHVPDDDRYKVMPASLLRNCTILLRDVAAALVDPPRYARKKPGA